MKNALLIISLIIAHTLSIAQVPFINSGQSLGLNAEYCAITGDIDNDGDIDVITASWGNSASVQLNDGTGNFTTPQLLPSAVYSGLELTDVDGDFDLDLICAIEGINSKLYFNDGTGNFTDSGQLFSTANWVTAGDFDADGDNDFLLVSRNGTIQDQVWINDGTGVFSGGQMFGANSSGIGADSGDIDGDNDIDLVFRTPGSVAIWLNDGTATFTQSVQSITSGKPGLYDFDYDGDLDLISFRTHTILYINDGLGNFSHHQTINSAPNYDWSFVDMADLDGDGFMDMYIPMISTSMDQIWMNDGSGNFSNSGSTISTSQNNDDARLADFNGDGTVDVYIAKTSADNEVWFNQSPPPCTINDQTVTAVETSFFCEGSTTVDVAGSDNGVYYFLRDDATNQIVDGPAQGTGGTMSFETGDMSADQTFHVFGMTGNALDFDGTDDYVTVPADPVLDFTGDFTIECIYKKSGTAFGSLFSQWEGGTNQKRIELHITGSDQLRLLISDDGLTNTFMVTADELVNLNEWSHVAAVFEAGVGVKLFMNGEEVTTTVTGVVPASVYATSSVTSLGNSRQGTGNLFTGKIDEIKVWTEAKTANQIESGIVSMLSGNETNLAAYWNFEDGAGITISDKTAGLNNGTMFNMDPNTDWTPGIMGGCELVMTEKPAITVDQISDQTLVTFETELCPSNTGTSVEIIASQIGVDYTLWDMNENTVVDGPYAGTGSAITFNTGTMVSSSDFYVFGEVPTNSGALAFDGSEYCLTSSNANIEDISDAGMTIEFWAKPTVFSSVKSMIRKTGDYDIYFLNNTLHAEIYNDGTTTRNMVVGPASVSIGVWTHIALTWDGSNATWYINGVPSAGSVSAGGPVGGVSNLGIGGSEFYAQHFSGEMDEVRIWKEVRSNTDINNYMNTTLTGSETNLVGYWDFEDGSGSSVASDISPSGNDAVLSNMEVSTDWVSRITLDCSEEITPTVSITVEDIVAPIADVTNLPDITSECSVTPVPPTATDNCFGAITGVPDLVFPISDQGTTVVTWTFEDDLGNTSQQTQSVILADVTVPTIDAPADMTVVANDVDCGATIASLGVPSAFDNCTVDFVSNDAPTVFPNGDTEVTWMVVDEAGNAAFATQIVTVENDMLATIDSAFDPSGCNVADGSVDIFVSGGSGDYTFDWNGGEFNTEDLTGVASGLYTAVITDSNGCTTEVSVGLSDPDAPTVVVDNTVEPYCSGSNNGSVEITVTGGQGPYQFDWSNDEPGDYDDLEDPIDLPAGTVSVVVMDANGCSTTETIEIDEPSPITFEQTLSICAEESLEVGTSVYTESGIYTDVLVNGFGCDSTVTTDLTVMPTFSSTQKVSICDGESFMVGDNVYTTSGSYTDVIESIMGCDSTVMTTLVVQPAIDVTVVADAGVFTVQQSGAQYQWMVCDNGYAIIPGATSQEFMPIENGEYAVQVTVGSCTAISDCIRMGVVGIDENFSSIQVDVYPNPTPGNVIIDLGSIYDEVTITLKNVLGQDIQAKKYFATDIITVDIEGETGYYLLEIKTANGETAVIKVLKE